MGQFGYGDDSYSLFKSVILIYSEALHTPKKSNLLCYNDNLLLKMQAIEKCNRKTSNIQHIDSFVQYLT